MSSTSAIDSQPTTGHFLQCKEVNLRVQSNAAVMGPTSPRSTLWTLELPTRISTQILQPLWTSNLKSSLQILRNCMLVSERTLPQTCKWRQSMLWLVVWGPTMPDSDRTRILQLLVPYRLLTRPMKEYSKAFGTIHSISAFNWPLMLK